VSCVELNNVKSTNEKRKLSQNKSLFSTLVSKKKLSCEIVTILILHDYLKTHAKIQTKVTLKQEVIREKLYKTNRMFVENDQSTL
jgi:hypothetical protein